MIQQQIVKVVCDRANHEQQDIAGVCTYGLCKSQRTCCAACLDDHSDHLSKIKFLKKLQIKYESSLNPLFELRDRILALITEIEKAITILTENIPKYPNVVNLETLNEFGEVLAHSTFRNKNILVKLKENIQNSQICIESSLKRVLYLIKKKDRNQFKKIQEAEEIRKQGLQKHQNSEFDQALELFNEALKLYDQDEVCWCNKGVTLSCLYRFEEAIECFDQAISIKPNDYLLYANKANSLNTLGKYQDALFFIEKSLTINPHYAFSWNEKGRALVGLNKKQQAIEAYKKSVEIEPDHHSLSNLANTYENLGKNDEALQYYQEALQKKSDHIFAIQGVNRLSDEI